MLVTQRCDGLVGGGAGAGRELLEVLQAAVYRQHRDACTPATIESEVKFECELKTPIDD